MFVLRATIGDDDVDQTEHEGKSSPPTTTWVNRKFAMCACQQHDNVSHRETLRQFTRSRAVYIYT